MTDLADRMQAAQDVSNDVARREPTLVDDLADLKPRLARALPAHLDPDRFIRIVTNLVQSGDPKLRECTRSSLMAAVMLSGQLGLEPDIRGLAYLIPRWSGKKQCLEVTFMIGYRGYIDLYRRSGLGVSLQAHVVHENDDIFEYEYGTDSHLRHRPTLGDRGAFKCAYAVAMYRGGGHDFIVLRPDEIARRRARSQAGDRGPWNTDEESMIRKTGVRALAPYLPQTPELAIAQRVDDAVHYEMHDSLMDYRRPDDGDDSSAGPDAGNPPPASAEGPPTSTEAAGDGEPNGNDVRGSASALDGNPEASDGTPTPAAEELPLDDPDACRKCGGTEYKSRGAQARVDTSDGPYHAECSDS